VIPDPTSDGDRCLVCERLLFPTERANGVCSACERATDDEED
jgi:methionyl-tRNA synthetase